MYHDIHICLHMTHLCEFVKCVCVCVCDKETEKYISSFQEIPAHPSCHELYINDLHTLGT